MRLNSRVTLGGWGLVCVMGLTSAAQAERIQADQVRAVRPAPVQQTSSSASPPSAVDKATKPAAPVDWSRAEIAAARKVCKRILKKYAAVATPEPSIKTGPCGDPAPVRLLQLGRDAVAFNPPPVVNCQMVAALGKWLKQGLQPLARRQLGGRLTEISVMSSYSCRNAYGRKNGNLSEHGKANALDIRGFSFDGDLKATVLADWGVPKRHLLAQAQANKRRLAAREAMTQRAKTETAAPPPTRNVAAAHTELPDRARLRFVAASASAVVGNSTSESGLRLRPAAPAQRLGNRTDADQPGFFLPPIPARRPTLKERMMAAQLARRAAERRMIAERKRLKKYRERLNAFLYRADHLGGPKTDERVTGRQKGTSTNPDRRKFLHAAHTSACKIFGTVLGPEANNAHRNHLHVDLAPRRRRNYCR